jgi:DNA-directed RNA polymerase alpha subunit
MRMVYQKKPPSEKSKRLVSNPISFLNTDINKLNFGPRAMEALKSSGFKNLGELIASIQNGLDLPNIGKISRLEIQKKFKEEKIKLPKNW